MKISEAMGRSADAEIDFGGGAVLKVVYRPSSMTTDDIDRLKKDRDVGRIVHQVREQIQRWDLTDDAGYLVPLEKPEPGAPDPLRAIPLHILTTVLIGVARAQRPDPEA